MQVLDMLADMRLQFAAMLADIRFLPPGPRGFQGRRGRDVQALPEWLDGPQPWNLHARQPAAVSMLFD